MGPSSKKPYGAGHRRIVLCELTGTFKSSIIRGPSTCLLSLLFLYQLTSLDMKISFVYALFIAKVDALENYCIIFTVQSSDDDFWVKDCT